MRDLEGTLILFSATIKDFNLIPKRRSPNKARYRVGSPTWKYYQNRDELAQLFALEYKGEPIAKEVSMYCAIHFSHCRGSDLDNSIGTVMDALEKAGVVENDKLIVRADKIDIYREAKGVARVVVGLKELRR